MGRKAPRPPIPEHIKQKFKIGLKISPRDWLKKAQSLRFAVGLLWVKYEERLEAYEDAVERNPAADPERPDDGPILLLLGLAIENALKGICSTAIEGSTPPENLAHTGIPAIHNLRELAMLALSTSRITISDDDNKILSVLEHNVTWAARYPSPRTIHELITIGKDGIFEPFYFV